MHKNMDANIVWRMNFKHMSQVYESAYNIIHYTVQYIERIIM